MNRFNLWLNIFCVLGVAMIIGILGATDKQRQAFDDKQYCLMVELYEASSGLNGWPDYRDDLVCPKSENRKPFSG